MLGNYKTEPCKKPPRLCRQGYACPYYHNSKDRRRSPRKHKYRFFGPSGQPWEEGGSRQIRAEAACTVLPGVGGREASPGGRRTLRAVGMFRRAKRSFGVKSGSFH